MAHRDLELIELTRKWRDAVVFDAREGYPTRLRSCWFGTREGLSVDLCEGTIEGAHWLKRQRVRHALEALGFDRELIQLAEWDPRNGVPACEKHHQRFDSQRMPPLVVPRRLVPLHVVDFTAAWGLETQLEDRCPGAA
jgi:hypothetical protein